MKASAFADYLLEQVNNHSLYVWGGQGEIISGMDFKTLRDMETSDTYFATVLETYAEHSRKGHDMSKSRAFDCSGLGVYFFIANNIIRNDMTAHDLFTVSKEVKLTDAQQGDFVFKHKTDSGKWGHIGYVVQKNGKLYVVEAKGRTYGVVISPITDGWVACARPSWWESEEYIFTKNLKNGCVGEDVVQLQLLLAEKGYTIVVDGEFGKHTEELVKKFQYSNRLDADGIAGKMTITTLGGVFK